ncbi:hypothetical protein PoB_005077000 [Plakobranchus ocellatus]|uniref:Uncharacterized protein n=1 Tax=Plakobranchus ocellatus TaxID=259542 RepID=A0AAV4BUZ4_9GAST|nr:hypothetical protein PoB_005077000 [Plakobranchus ocellatus]
MAVKGDSNMGSFTHYYDDEIDDDDEDDNHFIISLEDNGEEYTDFHSEKTSQDFPEVGSFSAPLRTKNVSPHQFMEESASSFSSYQCSDNLLQKKQLTGLFSDGSPKRVIGSPEKEILTFPTACISKPHSQSSNHGSNDPVKSFSISQMSNMAPSVHATSDILGAVSSSSSQENLNCLTAVRLPEYLKTAASTSISYPGVNCPNKNFNMSERLDLSRETSDVLTDAETSSLVNTLGNKNMAFDNSITVDPGKNGTEINLNSSTIKNNAAASLSQQSSLEASVASFKSKDHEINTCHVENLQSKVPKLSGPFPTIQKAVAEERDVFSTHASDSSKCPCIMCYKSVSKINNDKIEALEYPRLTQREIQIITNGESDSAKMRKRKTVFESHVDQYQPLESKLDSCEKNNKLNLPKLTMSRQLSISTSSPNFTKTALELGQINNTPIVPVVPPPLLLHKSAVKRNYTSLLSHSRFVTITSAQSLPASYQTVSSPSVLVVPSNKKECTGPSQNMTCNQKSDSSVKSIPLLLKGSTMATRIGSLVMSNTVTCHASSQSVMTTSVSHPQTMSSQIQFSNPNSLSVPSSSVLHLNNLPHQKSSWTQPPTVVFQNLADSSQTSAPGSLLQPTNVTSTCVGTSKGNVPAMKPVTLVNAPILLHNLSMPLPGSSVEQPKLSPKSSVITQTTAHSNLQQSSYQIVYVSPGEVLLCRQPLKQTNEHNSKAVTLIKQLNAPSSQPKQLHSKPQPETLTVCGNSPTLNTVLRKAEEIDLTTPGKVRIRLKEAQNIKNSPTKTVNSGSTASLRNSPSIVSSSSLLPNPPAPQSKPRNPTQKSPSKLASLSPRSPNVGITGSTLLKLIDTHFENQKLTSSEAALLQLIKGACKDPQILAATCKIAQQAETTALSKSSSSKSAKKEKITTPVAKSASADVFSAVKSSISMNQTESVVSASNNGQVDITMKTSVSIPAICLSPTFHPTQQVTHKKASGSQAARLKLATVNSRPISSVKAASNQSSHLNHPHLPEEGLPSSYVEDWVKQTKTFMSQKDYDDMFYQEIRDIDHCIANEVLLNVKNRGKISQNRQTHSSFDITSAPKTSNLKNQNYQNSNPKDRPEGVSLSEKSTNMSEQTIGKVAVSSDQHFSNDNYIGKPKHISSVVAGSKGIKLKIRLDEKLKRHIALKKKSRRSKFSSAHRFSSAFHKSKSNVGLSTISHNISTEKTDSLTPCANTSNEVVSNNDNKNTISKTETAEEMFQRFQEQAQEEVYKAQLGVGYLSRSLRPVRTTMAFLDKSSSGYCIGSGDQKKKKGETDKGNTPLIITDNNAQHKSTGLADQDKREDNKEIRGKKNGTIKSKRSLHGSSNRSASLKAQTLGLLQFRYPHLKEDISFPITKNVYCSNILAGHKVFVKFNTYENSSTGRCFLVPFFNIGGKRTQFDVEDVEYFNKAIIEFEKEEKTCARHLLYFCREGNKASFLRKESNFGTSQLHEKNYTKKSFVLEGFKMDALTPKLGDRTEPWKVDHEVAIEIDTADVDNDIEVDFEDCLNTSEALLVPQSNKVAERKLNVSQLDDASSREHLDLPFSKLLEPVSMNKSSNYKEPVECLTKHVVNQNSTLKKDESIFTTLEVDSPDSSYTQRLSRLILPLTSPRKEKTNAIEPHSLNIKEEKTDNFEYESEFNGSTDIIEQELPVDHSESDFQNIRIKEEPKDDYLFGKLSSDLDIECHDRNNLGVTDTVHTGIHSQKDVPVAKISNTDSTEQKKEPSVERFGKPDSASGTFLQDKHGPRGLGMSSNDFQSSTILCREVLACDAENVQVSLPDQQTVVTNVPHPSGEHTENFLRKHNISGLVELKQVSQGNRHRKDKVDYETNATVSEANPSCPTSPAPSSSISESSEISLSSELEESDQEDDWEYGLSAKEAQASHTSTLSIDSIEGPEGKNGPVQHKITSLVESLRQRLAQQASNLPPWLANIPPAIIHSKLKNKKGRSKKSKSRTSHRLSTSVSETNTVPENSSVKEFLHSSDCTTINTSSDVTVTSPLLHKDQPSNNAPCPVAASLPLTTTRANNTIISSSAFATSELVPCIVNSENESMNTHSKPEATQDMNSAGGDSEANESNSIMKLSRKTKPCSNEVKNDESQVFMANASAVKGHLTSVDTNVTNIVSEPSLSFPSVLQTVSNGCEMLDSAKVLDTNVKFFEKSNIKPEIIEKEPEDIANKVIEAGCVTKEGLKLVDTIHFPPVKNVNGEEFCNQQSSRSTPSDVEIEVGFYDLPETLMQFQPIVPAADLDVCSIQGSQSPCLSPVAAVVDYLHNRTKSRNQNCIKSKVLPKSQKPVSCIQNNGEEEKGSVASYLSQKYSVDMTPGSGVWHTIKGPRLRRAQAHSNKSTVNNVQISTASVEQTPSPAVSTWAAEPISTEELSKKPSLSEIFGISVDTEVVPQKEIKKEIIPDSDPKITVNIRSSKRQVARKKTSAKHARKCVEIEQCLKVDCCNDENSSSSQDKSHAAGSSKTKCQLDEVHSMTNMNIEPPASPPKIRMTWRQLSKLSQKQKKENPLNNISPCRVLLSRLEETNDSLNIERINPFTFKIIEGPQDLSDECIHVKVEKDTHDSDATYAQKGKRLKKKKKKAVSGKSKRRCTKPQKDIVDHFASMLDSLRKKAMQLEEEAKKKEEEDEAKKKEQKDKAEEQDKTLNCYVDEGQVSREKLLSVHNSGCMLMSIDVTEKGIEKTTPHNDQIDYLESMEKMCDGTNVLIQEHGISNEVLIKKEKKEKCGIENSEEKAFKECTNETCQENGNEKTILKLKRGEKETTFTENEKKNELEKVSELKEVPEIAFLEKDIPCTNEGIENRFNEAVAVQSEKQCKWNKRLYDPTGEKVVDASQTKNTANDVKCIIVRELQLESEKEIDRKLCNENKPNALNDEDQSAKDSFSIHKERIGENLDIENTLEVAYRQSENEQTRHSSVQNKIFVPDADEGLPACKNTAIGEEDHSSDWDEEPGSLVIHLPEDEVVDEKFGDFTQTVPLKNNSLVLAQSSFEDQEVNMSTKSCSDIKKKDCSLEDNMNFSLPSGDQDGLESIKSDYFNMNLASEDPNKRDKVCPPVEDSEGTNNICEESENNQIASSQSHDKLACIDGDLISFPKTDIVLSSVLDEDFANCFGGKSSKKDSMIMFEQQDDLDGDDMGIIPQDEVERLLGLCDEDSEPVVLPGLGPLPKDSNTLTSASERPLEEKPCSRNSKAEISNTSALNVSPPSMGPWYPQLSRENEVAVRDEKNTPVSECEGISNRLENVTMTKNKMYRLPSRTTVMSRDASPSQALDTSIVTSVDNCKDKEKDSIATSNELKQNHIKELKLPKLQLKLDAGALAAIQKAKSAFLKKKNLKRKRNDLNSISSTNLNPQFQQDMEFYMRSTRSKRQNLTNDAIDRSDMSFESLVPQGNSEKIDILKEKISNPCHTSIKAPVKHSFKTLMDCNSDTKTKATSQVQFDAKRASDVNELDFLETHHKAITSSRKRKNKLPDWEKSCPSDTKAKKVESIFEDTDIFKRSQTDIQIQPDVAKSLKSRIPASELLKKTKSIDISKLKMKLNPVLSKNIGVLPSQKTPDLSQSENSVATKTILSEDIPIQSSQNGTFKFVKSQVTSKGVDKISDGSSQTAQDENESNKSKPKTLPNLNTAKLCNLLKNIQKKSEITESDKSYHLTDKDVHQKAISSEIQSEKVKPEKQDEKNRKSIRILRGRSSPLKGNNLELAERRCQKTIQGKSGSKDSLRKNKETDGEGKRTKTLHILLIQALPSTLDKDCIEVLRSASAEFTGERKSGLTRTARLGWSSDTDAQKR